MAHVFYTCITCGKPLTNPVSQAVGQGAVCRVSGKNAGLNKLSLFGMRAKYNWGFLRPRNPKFEKSIIWIEDQGVGAVKSVTNDMDNVLTEISAEVYDITRLGLGEFLFMYRDSDGIWDGIDVKYLGMAGPNPVYSATIFSLNRREQEEAAEKLWDIRGRIPKKVEEEPIAEE